MFKQLLKLPLWAVLVIAILIFIVIAVIFSSLNPWNPLNFFSRPQTTVNVDRDAVVTNIQSLNRLETTSFTIEKVIEAGNQGNAFQNILYGDRLLLIAHGHIRAGVDLSSIKPDDIKINGNSLTIQLPETEILSSELDTNKTTVYDRQHGLLNRGDKDLETQARQAAEKSIRSAACDADILGQAAKDTKEHLAKMYTLAGFESVKIEVEPGTCD